MALTQHPAPAAGPRLDEEEHIALRDRSSRDKFEALVRRLSEQSVLKHYDAYADIPWDEPEFAVDQDDPRWELPEADPLGSSDWYRNQPAGVRSRIGLYRYASAAKLGGEFENVLKRGLLEHAFRLENHDPTFRYIYHEVVEEAHHGMMFQEFVNRSGLPIDGMPKHLRAGANSVVLMGRVFPELFFIFVLGGEDPIDYVQREILRRERELPPVIETMMRHHVTEEARHLSFARHYLKQEVPKLGFIRRTIMSIAAPIILGIMAQMMLKAPAGVAREFHVPDDVMRASYHRNPQIAESTRDGVKKVRKLCREIGLLNPVSTVLWRVLGIYAKD